MERVQIATHITKLFVKTTILFLQCISKHFTREISNNKYPQMLMQSTPHTRNYSCSAMVQNAMQSWLSLV